MNTLKRIALLLILAATALPGRAQVISMCAGTSTVVTAINSAGLSNPSYSLNPGGIISGVSSFTVAPTNPTTYTLYVTGFNNMSALVTTTNVVTVMLDVSPTFSLISPQNFTIGCNPVNWCKLEITNATAAGAPVSYTFFTPGSTPTLSPAGALSGVNVHTATIAGSWSVAVRCNVNGCTTWSTVTVAMNPGPLPSVTVTPSLQNVGCLASSVTQVTAVASNTNCSISFLSPPGGIVQSASTPAFFMPNIGTNTCIVKDNLTGCELAETFTVTSANNFPLFGLTSTTNFSLGCNSASVSAIQIINAQSTIPPGGGPVLFSLLNPAGTTVVGPGGQSSHLITTPGDWSVLVKDAVNGCESRAYFSVIQSTVSPQLSVSVPFYTFDCNSTQITLQASSSTTNTGFTWSFNSFPSPVPGSALQVTANVAAPTSTFVDSYTVVAMNLGTFCKSSTVIPVYQNIFPPVITIGINSLTACQPTLMLNNLSTTGIPAGVFPNSWPIIASLWQGPPPQIPASSSNTYVAQTPGVYTLTAKDQNNNCWGSATLAVSPGQVTSAFVHTITGAQAVFSDASTGAVPGANYFWDFGDGNTSTLQNPTHNYTNAGAYLVKLKVTNPASLCPDSSIQSVNISGIPCVANSGFSMVPTGTAQVWNVVPSYPWNVTAAKWSWGDGQVSNTLYTSHQYAVAGMYNICLSVTVSCGDTSSTCTTYSVYRGTQEAGILEVNVVPPALISGLASLAADAQFSWNIVPNPNSGEFKVSIENAGTETVRMMISDLTGRIVYDQLNAASQSAHSCNLPPGMYLVTLESEGVRTTKRMVVYR